MSDAASRRVKAGTHNFITTKYEHSPEWYLKIRQRMSGKNNPSKNPITVQKRITDDYRKKQAEGSKGNTNVRGKRWWNDGMQRKRSALSPGEGWIEGFRLNSNNEKSQTN